MVRPNFHCTLAAGARGAVKSARYNWPHLIRPGDFVSQHAGADPEGNSRIEVVDRNFFGIKLLHWFA